MEEPEYRRLVQTNNVAHGWLDRTIDTKKLASRFKGGMFAGSKTGGFQLNMVYPKCSATIQRTGRIHIMATLSRAETQLAMVKVVALLRKHGVNVSLSQDGHVTNNVVCSARTWPLNLAKMQAFAPLAVVYRPEFPSAAVLNVKNLGFPGPTKVVIECFQSGMLNLTGSKSFEESNDVFVYCIEHIFRHVRVANSTTTEVAVLERVAVAPPNDKGEEVDDEGADEEMRRVMAEQLGADEDECV